MLSLQLHHNERDGVSNHQPHDCLPFIQGVDPIKSQSSASLGDSPVTGEFPTQKASNAENVSIRLRHHGFYINRLGECQFTDTCGIFINLPMIINVLPNTEARSICHWLRPPGPNAALWWATKGNKAPHEHASHFKCHGYFPIPCAGTPFLSVWILRPKNQ